MVTMEKDLCEAYRKGCREAIGIKIDVLERKLALTDAKATLTDTKVDLLKNNEVMHLQIKLEEIRKEKRRPLGNREWAIIISAFIAAASAVIVAVIKR